MSTESRVQYLLKAAERAEREGNGRLASILRRMAAELTPPELGIPLPGSPQAQP
jgi:hypothetical protein